MESSIRLGEWIGGLPLFLSLAINIFELVLIGFGIRYLWKLFPRDLTTWYLQWYYTIVRTPMIGLAIGLGFLTWVRYRKDSHET